MRSPILVKKAVQALPLALSQTRFAKLIAPRLPLNEASRKALSFDYSSDRDREEALLTVTRSINENVYRTMVENSKATSVGSEGVYNPDLLQIYDDIVWEYNSPFLWQITKDEILDLYRDCMATTTSHCEIAVGTGYFLDAMLQEGQEQIAKGRTTIALMDLNPNTLEVCEKRLQLATKERVSVEKLHCDIVAGRLEGTEDVLQDSGSHYDSVAANFLFHCLHDDDHESLETTSQAISNIRQLVHPEDGVFFGSTILGKDMLSAGNSVDPSAMETLEKYNEWGIFGNLHDSMEGISDLLHENFGTVDVWQSGYCAVWKAKHPKP